MNRREILIAGGGVAVSLATTACCIRGARLRPRFLLVFLRGGYGLRERRRPRSSRSTTSPTEHRHCEARAGGSGDRTRTRCRLGAKLPALRLHDRRSFAAGRRVLPCAGTDDLRAAHFETRTASSLASRCRVRAIFAGVSRQAEWSARRRQTDRILPTHFRFAFEAGGLPNISLRNVGKPTSTDRQARLLKSMFEVITLSPRWPTASSSVPPVRARWTSKCQDAQRGGRHTERVRTLAERVVTPRSRS